MMPPSDVERILQSALIIRSNIEENRKAMFGMDSAQRGVKSHFPNWNTHASSTLIAESQYAFSIANDDAFHTVIARMSQDVFDTILIRIAEKQSAWLSPYLTEALASLTYSRCVDQRQHLFDIANQERIKQGLVCILKVAKKAVFTEGVWLSSQSLQPSLNLFIK